MVYEFDKKGYLKKVEEIAVAMQKEIEKTDRKHNSDVNKVAVYFQGARGLSNDFIKHIKRY
ncbi:MAG TPA: hypothetical protein VJB11_02875 [archaeon]|nr:hypothetical protein [archaeon]